MDQHHAVHRLSRPGARGVARFSRRAVLGAAILSLLVVLIPGSLATAASPAGAPRSASGWGGEGPLAEAEHALTGAGGPLGATGPSCTAAGGAGRLACPGPLPAVGPLAPRADAAAPAPAWTRVNTTGTPTARVNALLAFDPVANFVLMYGGDNASAVPPVCENGCAAAFAQTWAYSGGTWRLLPIASPPARIGGSMVFDPVDGYVLLFGGQLWCNSPPCPLDGSTWAFRDGGWKDLNLTGPAPRMNAQITFDAADGYVLLFGGELANGALANDTWSYAHGVWTETATVGPPSDPFDSSMAYDAADGYVVLLSGYPSAVAGIPNPVTWAYSAGVWSLVAVSSPLPGLYGGWLVYDPALGGVLLLGEQIGGAGAAPFNYSWVYFGGAWQPLPGLNPSLRLGISSLTYDVRDGYVLGFGGEQWANGTLPSELLNDTWSFVTPPLGFVMSVAVSPPGVCPQTNNDCPAGTNETRVVMSLETEYVSGPIGSPDTGAIVADPTFQFVPFGEVRLPSNVSRIDPQVVCSDPEGFTGVCNVTTRVVPQPDGRAGLAWTWSSDPHRDQMLVRAKWSASFEVTVLAPPYGDVPVDACTTFACLTAGSSALFGNYTWIRFDPYGNGTSETVSLPVAEVLVESPLAPSGTPAVSAPPPAPELPGPPGGIVPVPIPPGPSSVAAPPGAGPVLPALAPVGAGAIAAGFTRMRVKRKVAMGVAATSGALVPGSRGPKKDRTNDGRARGSRFE